MFARIAAGAAARPRTWLVLTALVALAALLVGRSAADRLDPYGADDPASESIRAERLIERTSGVGAEPSVLVLVRSSRRIAASPAARARVRRLAAAVTDDRDVARVVTPLDRGARALISDDGRAAYLPVFLAPASDRVEQEAAERLVARLGDERGVSLGGPAVANAEIDEQVGADLARAELLAFPLLFVLSLVFFRGLVAAALPPVVGGLAIVATTAVLRGLAELGSISVFALNLVLALGLGLAIDYSLFVVSRYREELARRGPGVEALRATLQTAGRTVLFSALTVAAALASLCVFPQRFLYSMGIGGAAVALIAAAVTLLVLPAALALLGPRVDALAPARLQRRAAAEARPDPAGRWYRLARLVTRRPGAVALATTALLLACGAPFLRAEFVQADAAVLPTSAGARQVDDVLDERFEATRARPLRVVVAAPRGGKAVERVRAQAREVPGVLDVGPARALSGEATLVEVVPRADPLTRASERLVGDLRRRLAASSPAPVLLAGDAAEFVDLKASLRAHLAIALPIVVGATLVLLFLMTGSLVLPVKSLLMNALSLAATFGLLVLVFQDGRLEGLLAYESQGALEVTQPILLLAVALGLATDYAVFLLSRIKEARDGGHGDSEAVALGLERTGRIVTAAAVLFAVAVGAFATSEIVFIKQVGIGTALAVLIDATLIRALLVPALMELLGRRNWWAPAPLRRLHRRVGLVEPT